MGEDNVIDIGSGRRKEPERDVQGIGMDGATYILGEGPVMVSGTTDGDFLPTGWAQPRIGPGYVDPLRRRPDYTPDLCYRCSDRFYDGARRLVASLGRKPIAEPAE